MPHCTSVYLPRTVGAGDDLGPMKSALALFAVMVVSAGCGAGAVGPQGPRGLTGADGRDGADGQDGTDGQNGNSVFMVSGWACSKVSGGLFFQYDAYLFSSGDRLASCSVGGTSTQSGATKFYPSGTGGADTAYCAVTFDLDASSAGFWSFSATPGGSTTYIDSGSSFNGATVTFTSGDCTNY